MTNPTSNFGWQMPTPTDLVTDLPADFEVFGQAVDTSMADLKGGTTGQILSKATNADMDFTWITNDVGDITNIAVTSPITGGGSSGSVTIGVSAASTSAAGVVQLSDSTSTTSSVLASTPTATKSAYDLADTANTAAGAAQTTANNAIAKSTVTTAGDIIYRNATVPTRLGIGTAGQVLTVNSGATAPEWKTPTSGMNLISRTTFSNTSAHIVDNVFSSTYSSYMVVIERIYGATSTDELQLQMRYGSTTQNNAYYFGGSRGVDNAGNLTSVLSSFATSFKIWERISTVGFPSSVNMTFTGVGNSSEAARWYGTGIYGNTPYAFFTGGEIASSAGYQTYTGFLLKSSSSNVTGEVAVYGLAK